MAQAAPKLAPAQAAPEAQTPSQTPPRTLAAALLAAQRAVRSVAKGSTNEYDRYQYTSADTMVAACRDALHEADLVLSLEGWAVDPAKVPPEAVLKFRLEHPPSDQSRQYEIPWPVVANQKRLYAVDKALAGGLTTAMGYFERGLLNLPRADPNEMDRREDPDVAPAASKPSEASSTLQADIAARVGLLKDERHVKIASTYLDRAGHDLKLLRQVQGWVEAKIVEQGQAPEASGSASATPDEPATPPPATARKRGPAPAREPVLEPVDLETGEVMEGAALEPEEDPESPLFGLKRGDDGP